MMPMRITSESGHMKRKTDIIPELQASLLARSAAGYVGPSGNHLADAVLSGHEWKTATLTYAFPDGKSDYGYKGERDHGFSPVNAKIQQAARQILDESFGNRANDAFSVEGFTQLSIRKGNDRSADIRYAESKSAEPTAYAYYPDGRQIGGDVWFGKNAIYDSPRVGNYAFATVLHETGHALGLKHGHQAESFDTIKKTLNGRYDSLEYSVMTYHSYAGADESGYTNEIFGFPQSYMMADILALQHMYGADFSINSGDTTYRWTPGSGITKVNGEVAIRPGANRIFATIWDGGGEDTYNLSAYSSDLSIDLRPGRYSIFKESQLADLNAFMNGKDASGNIYNALQYHNNNASLIENAVGGSGRDTFQGNAADNIFTGNGGADRFIFRQGTGHDTITDLTGQDRIDLKGWGLDFATIQSMGQDIGGDVVINFGGGDTLTIEDRTLTSLHGSDFMFG